MSDTPVFQDADAREATAPSEQPVEADTQDAPLDAPPLVVPAAGALGGGLAGATGPGAGSVGTGAPAVGGAALEADTNDARRAPGGATSPGAVDDSDTTGADR